MPPCKACGRELVFAKTHDGANLPLERNTPVFAVHMDDHSNFRAAKTEQDLNGDNAVFLALHKCQKEK